MILSPVKFIALTSFLSRENVDVGDITFAEKIDLWRPMNLLSVPFSLPFPDDIIHENCTESNGEFNDKCLCVWKTESLREWLAIHNVNAIVNL